MKSYGIQTSFSCCKCQNVSELGLRETSPKPYDTEQERTKKKISNVNLEAGNKIILCPAV